MSRENVKEESMLASFYRMSRDGRSWIVAEAALAKAEVASDGRRLAKIIALFALVFGCVFAAVLLLTFFVVVLLAPYVGGMANAAGMLSLGLIAIAALATWRIWSLTSKQLGFLSVLKRWWSIVAAASEKEDDAK